MIEQSVGILSDTVILPTRLHAFRKPNLSGSLAYSNHPDFIFRLPQGTHMATILLAAADWAAHYRAADLDLPDRIRVQRQPALAQRRDWQVSRALKHAAASEVRSLAHSQGAAALLCGIGRREAAGIDIEHCRLRDFQGLAEWVMSAEERQWWAACADQAAAFYALWTLKEALIKAADLAFPADMPRVGLHRVAAPASFSDGLHLHAADGRVWAAHTRFIGGYAVSCVADKPFAPQWQRLGAWANTPWQSAVLGAAAVFGWQVG